MPLQRTLRFATLALAASVCPLAAADIQWGATVGLGLPASDLKTYTDSRMGLSLGAQATIGLGQGHAIRPRLDVSRFRSPWVGNALRSARGTLDTFKIGADYLYGFKGAADGVYAIGGLGASVNRGVVDLAGNWGDEAFEGDTVTEPYVQVGVGYQINRNWGVEAYHTLHKLSENETFAATFMAVTARF